jgi:DNA-binding transcriptional ArsR family regulator
MKPDDIRILDNLESLKIYFDPFRLKIVKELSYEARTIHEVADILDVPFTRLYYQFNLLEQHGIIRVVDTRPKVGAIEEKVYRITAYQFVIARHLVNADKGDLPEGIRAVLDATFDEVRHEIERNVRHGIIDLQALSPQPQALLTRRGVFVLTAEQAQQLHQDLSALMMRYGEIVPQDNSHEYGFTISLFPTQLNIDEPE